MDVSSLKRRILRNRFCSEVFRLSGDVYVVGGYIRDLVFKGVHSMDMDFVVPKNVRPLAASVAEALGGSVVELKKERMTRVALKDGITLDFSRMEGDILDDLKNRDFTINAMAWSPSSGLLDPVGGIEDIERGIIRSLSDENLQRDPLRLLRAYRFQAELGMPIERRTRASIRRLAGKVRQPASERITLEFFKLLNSENPLAALKEALSDCILSRIIPLNIRGLNINIKSLSLLQKNIKKLHERLYLKVFSQGLSVRGLLRLEAVMLGSEPSASKLSLSTDIRKRVETSGKFYLAFKNIDKSNGFAVYDIFHAADEAAFDLLMLTGRLDLMSELRRFNRIRRGELFTTGEIITITGVREGPGLGRVLRELKRLRFAKKIRGRRAARRWLTGLRSY